MKKKFFKARQAENNILRKNLSSSILSNKSLSISFCKANIQNFSFNSCVLSRIPKLKEIRTKLKQNVRILKIIKFYKVVQSY